MFEKLIKNKIKKTYIGLFVLSLLVVLYNGYLKYSSFKVIDYSNIKSQIMILKLQNKKLQKLIQNKNETFKMVSKKVINETKFRKDISLLSKGIIDGKLISKIEITKINIPYKYLNVAQIIFNINNPVDMLVFKRLLMEIYNIKTIYNKDTKLIVEIYKDV